MESESIVERVKFAILPYLNPDIGDREATKAARAAISAMPLEELLAALSDEQRLELFHAFCVHCGGTSKPCYCMRDD